MSIVIDANMKLFADRVGITSSRMIRDYGLSSVDEIIVDTDNKISQVYDLDERFFAADGHFGNKSKNLVKDFATDLGFRYISASSKDEFLSLINGFTSSNSEAPIVFEVFTNDSYGNNCFVIL